MPSPLSQTEIVMFLSSWLTVTTILPPAGVYLKAFDKRLKKMRSIFSGSIAKEKSSSICRSMDKRIFCLRAMLWKASIHSRRSGTKRTSCKWRSNLPFSYLRKSRIWFSKRLRIWMFLWAIRTNSCCWSVRFVALSSCSIGSEINVSGVRKSCDTFVKKVSFECVACFNCSFNTRWASRCCSNCRLWANNSFWYRFLCQKACNSRNSTPESNTKIITIK